MFKNASILKMSIEPVIIDLKHVPKKKSTAAKKSVKPKTSEEKPKKAEEPELSIEEKMRKEIEEYKKMKESKFKEEEEQIIEEELERLEVPEDIRKLGFEEMINKLKELSEQSIKHASEMKNKIKQYQKQIKKYKETNPKHDLKGKSRKQFEDEYKNLKENRNLFVDEDVENAVESYHNTQKLVDELASEVSILEQHLSAEMEALGIDKDLKKNKSLNGLIPEIEKKMVP